MSAVSLIQSILSKHGPLTIREMYTVSSRVSAAALASSSSDAIPPPAEAAKLPETPENDRVIPSMSFLRRHVLPEVKRYGTFQQIHVRREPSTSELSPSPTSKKSKPKPSNTSGDNLVSAWVWRKTPSELIEAARMEAEAKEKKKAPKRAVRYFRPSPELVGSEEYGRLEMTRAAALDHLNVRRARARPVKIAKEREVARRRELVYGGVEEAETGSWETKYESKLVNA